MSLGYFRKYGTLNGFWTKIKKFGSSPIPILYLGELQTTHFFMKFEKKYKMDPPYCTVLYSRQGWALRSFRSVCFILFRSKKERSVLFSSFGDLWNPKERSVLFRSFLKFWRLMKPKRTFRSFLFFSKERKRTQRTFRSF